MNGPDYGMRMAKLSAYLGWEEAECVECLVRMAGLERADAEKMARDAVLTQQTRNVIDTAEDEQAIAEEWAP